jgi:hypothetical protein
MDSGIDPIALMSQLAACIMDIIAGTYKLAVSTCNGVGIGGRSCKYFQVSTLLLRFLFVFCIRGSNAVMQLYTEYR